MALLESNKSLISNFSILQWPPRGVVDYYDPANYEDYLIPEYGGYYDDEDDGRRGRKSGGGSGRRDS